MTELRLVGLVKRFGAVAAVDGVDLIVAPGSLVALLGPSGCGKTTSLRLIAGLEEPSSGDVWFDGASVVGTPTERRGIGMVFQRYVLFPHMSVEKNVSFGLRMRGVEAAEMERRVADVLEVVQLGPLARRFPSQLSGGQQQRVAIARAVVTDPRVMLMDEPLANLDAKLREEMRAFIKGLQRRLGLTTVFVTHDQAEAIEMADRIAVMFDGRLAQVGTPEEVFCRPRDRRVAEFMGSDNFIRGTLDAVDREGISLRSPLGPLRAAPGPDHPVGADVVATVRPEHVELSRAQVPIGQNRFLARVLEGVYRGGTLSYRIAAAGGVSLQVTDRSTRRFGVGDEVLVGIEPEHVWVLPAEPDPAGRPAREEAP